MLDVFHGELNFLKILSIIAFFTTVGLFFCGIPICRQIWKRNDTTEISGAPFLMGVLGGTCWCVYGYLKKDETVLYVTGTQIVLYSSYTVFYWFMTKKKLWISIKIVALVGICASLVTLVHLFDHKVFHPLGIVCMTLNTMDFAAPLAGLRLVLQRKATSTLPLPLCIANFLVSSEWFLYGLLVWDFYLITPNGIGSILAFAQLILFIVLPRKLNQRAPFLRLYEKFGDGFCCGMGNNSLDLESANVVPSAKSSVDNALDIHRTAAGQYHRWSSALPLVLIQKVHLGDQFCYSDKLNKCWDKEDTNDGSQNERKDEKCEDEALKCEAMNQKLDKGTEVDELSEEREDEDGEEEEDEKGEKPMFQQWDDDGQEEGASTSGDDDGEGNEASDEELNFPITIRDASQLLRLSRHFGKNKRKKVACKNFGRSLQPQHFKALLYGLHHHQNTAATGGGNVSVPIIVAEEDFDCFPAAAAEGMVLKKASSEPNLLLLKNKNDLEYFERL